MGIDSEFLMSMEALLRYCIKHPLSEDDANSVIKTLVMGQNRKAFMWSVIDLVKN